MKETLGHRIAHLAIALICFTRAFAYSEVLRPPRESPGPLFLTDEGRYLWLYALFWAVAGALALVDAVRRQTAWSVPMFLGLMSVWGLSYVGAWAYSGFESWDWLTGALYLGVAATMLGAHFLIISLRRQVTVLRRELHRDTGIMQTRGQDDGG